MAAVGVPGDYFQHINGKELFALICPSAHHLQALERWGTQQKRGLERMESSAACRGEIVNGVVFVGVSRGISGMESTVVERY